MSNSPLKADPLDLLRFCKIPLDMSSISMLMGCESDTAFLYLVSDLQRKGHKVQFISCAFDDRLHFLTRLAQGLNDLKLTEEEQKRIATLLFNEIVTVHANSIKLMNAYKQNGEDLEAVIARRDHELIEALAQIETLKAPKPEESADPNPLSDEQIGVMMRRIDDPQNELSTQVRNSLRNAGINHIWELVENTENDLRPPRTRNFGRKSRNEVKDFLDQFGLFLGRKFKRKLFTDVVAE